MAHEHSTTTAPQKPTTGPSAPSGGSSAGGAMKVQLRGKSFAEQEASLAPVQMDKPPGSSDAPQPGNASDAGAAPAQDAATSAQAPAGGQAEQASVGSQAPTGPTPAAAPAPAPPQNFEVLAATIQQSFAALAGMKAGDANIPVELNKILGPLGVTVAAPAPGTPSADGPQQWLDAVGQTIAATIPKLPTTIVDKPWTPSLLGSLEAIQRFQTYRNLKQNGKFHADEAWRPALLVLNKLYGIEQVGIAWQGNGTKQGRQASGAGLSAAAAAMAYVGTVNHSAQSGQTQKVADKSGNQVDVSTVQGADTLWSIWQGGADAGYIDVQGGEAGIKKAGHTIGSWCGIFVTHVLNQSGGGGGKWVVGGTGVDFKGWPSKSPLSKVDPMDPVAGDIAYSNANNQHYCIVVRRDGDTIYTVDGNSGPGGATAGGQIVANARTKSWFSNIHQRP